MKPRLFGIGEPVYFREVQDGIDSRESIDIIDALGAGSWREWMHITSLLESPSKLRQGAYEKYTETLNYADSLGIEITGMNHTWFKKSKKSGVPDIDHTAGSDYMDFLAMYEESFFTLASAFPQVSYWEAGNESNHDVFMHPHTYDDDMKNNRFTIEEKAVITADMSYFATKGIRRAGSNAGVIMPSPAPVDRNGGYSVRAMADFLALVYEHIKSGKSWSAVTDDYFTALAWHPYYWDRTPDAQWVDDNRAVYDTAVRYGDGHKKVFFTEMGYTEAGRPEMDEVNAGYIERLYEIVKNEMPYVYCVHLFRLLEDVKAMGERQSADWGGVGEVYFGIYTEPQNGFLPKAKAKAFQKASGGNGNLYIHAKE